MPAEKPRISLLQALIAQCDTSCSADSNLQHMIHMFEGYRAYVVGLESGDYSPGSARQNSVEEGRKLAAADSHPKTTMDSRLKTPTLLQQVNQHLPSVILAALLHVRSFNPKIDRVTFWCSGKWQYSTDDHDVPALPEGVDVGILEAAADYAEQHGGLPVSFEMNGYEALSEYDKLLAEAGSGKFKKDESLTGVLLHRLLDVMAVVEHSPAESIDDLRDQVAQAALDTRFE